MYIKEIFLENFRNYEKQKIILEKGINIFYGDNAHGKTNVIESIFLCSLGKSFRTNKDKELIKFNEPFANVKIDYEKQDRNGTIKAQIGDKKEFFINGVKQNKISSIIRKNKYCYFFTRWYWDYKRWSWKKT